MKPLSYISKLGLVASHKRKISDGKQYDKYFPLPQRTDPLLKPAASVIDTLGMMAGIISKTKEDTAKIAPLLKGHNLTETCHKIWDFCYKYIQYEKDKDGEEQLRRPSRTWADRKSGVDCDCFSIFVSSILSNLGIDHALRICEINGKGYFQHVYVVVPVRNSVTLVIDPVLDKFNLEAPGITKTHEKMIPVRYLNGVDSEAPLFGAEFIPLYGCACQSGHEVAQTFTKGVKNHLDNTRRIIRNNRKCGLGALYDDNKLLGALDYVLSCAGDDDAFGDALAQVAPYEHELYTPAMMGIDDELLGELGKAKKSGIFTKAAAAVKVVKNEAKKATSKESIKKVAEVAKKASKTIIRVNPLVVAARTGFLLAMEINLFGMANQLRWGYATPEQLRKYGVSAQDAAKAKNVLTRVEVLFADKMQGTRDHLKKAILSGKQALHGLSGFLGEPVTAATGTAAASGFIATVVEWIKKAGLVIKEHPDQAKQLLDLAKSKLAPKNPTTVKNNAIVETPKVTPPDNSFPNSNEITQSLTPASQEPSAPAPSDSAAPPSGDQNTPASDQPANTDNSTSPDTKPASSNSKGWLVAAGLVTAGIIGISMANHKKTDKPRPALSGPGKKKTKHKKTKTIKVH